MVFFSTSSISNGIVSTFKKGSSPKYLILWMYNIDSSSLGWSHQYYCDSAGTVDCNPIRSTTYVSSESEAAIICINHDNYPRIFQVDLNDGTMSGSNYMSSTLYDTVRFPKMDQFGSSDTKIMMYFRLSNGYVV